MIGKLSGKIIHRQPPTLLLDVNGVGYEVSAPMSTFYQLPEDSEKTISLWIHTVVREDAFALYGFCKASERDLFRALIKVNGVGPKLALTILSGIEVNAFVNAIQAQDADRLTPIPGIGAKTAQRLLIETKDRLGAWLEQYDSSEPGAENIPEAAQAAQDALLALGYKPAHAKRAIDKVRDPQLTCEELIRLALRQLSGEPA